MKIAYVSPDDASDPTVQSGRPASILRELERAGPEIDPVFPLVIDANGAANDQPFGDRLFGKYYRGDGHRQYLAALAAQVDLRTRDQHCDLIFSQGSEAIAHLRTTLPIVFCAEATFANFVNYYWDFTYLSPEYLRAGHAQDAAALARASLAIYPSEWAAQSAIKDYSADPARVVVIPFGANHGHDNRRGQVSQWIIQRPTDRLRLLFIGRNWDRKGGDIVVATALYLIAQGYRVTLDIVGVSLPAQHRDLPWIRSHGLLSPGDPVGTKKLQRLLAEAHFVMVPSQAEVFGMVLAEANAFGVPVIATRTGGVSAVVRSGQNGLLFPPGTPAIEFAAAIGALADQPAAYCAMCQRAFAEFENRLNWRVFIQKFLAAVEEKVGAGSQLDAPPQALNSPV